MDRERSDSRSDAAWRRNVLLRVLDHLEEWLIVTMIPAATGLILVADFRASFVSEMWHTGKQSNDLEAPMWMVYLTIPLGSGLMCFRFLEVAWSCWRTGELPHQDHGAVAGVEVDALHPADVDPRKAANERSSALGWILILLPILIVAVCFAHSSGLITLPHGLRVATVFA